MRGLLLWIRLRVTSLLPAVLSFQRQRKTAKFLSTIYLFADSSGFGVPVMLDKRFLQQLYGCILTVGEVLLTLGPNLNQKYGRYRYLGTYRYGTLP